MDLGDVVQVSDVSPSRLRAHLDACSVFKLQPHSLLSGGCNHDDLLEEEVKRPAPPRPEEEEEDPVTDIEAELLWDSQPHPPRGDVPNRRPYLDYGEEEPQDQAAPSYSHAHYNSRQPTRTGTRSGPRVRHGGLKVGVSHLLVTS